MHEGSILPDIAWIMVGAMAAALLCQRLKLPPLLGYLIAGFFLGPHLGLWSAMVNQSNVSDLSELGVIFLMFYIGLEFDLEKLRQVIAPAAIALILQTLLMIYVGIEACQWLGYSPMTGLFLGCVLSISSSMVSLKVIRDIGLIHQKHAQFTIGILVLEDVLAILLLVVLSGVAEKGQLDWIALRHSGLLILVFVVAVFLIGKLSTPQVIRTLEKRGTAETITLVTLGVIFCVSFFADRFHFSWALGGFMAGAIFSGSRLAKRIEHLTEPLRDFFSAMFFVSVGLLIDPVAIWLNWMPVLLLSVIVIAGKFITCWIGLFLSGQSPREAGRASMIKSQIGEFGFVIVALAFQYGVASPELQAIVTGVAFVTIFATPFLIRNEEEILDFFARRAPRSASNFCFLYGKWRQATRISIRQEGWLKLAGKPIVRIVIEFLIFVGVVLGAAVLSQTVPPPDFLDVSRLVFQRCLFIASLLVSLPFLVDTIRNLNVLMLLLSEAALSKKVFQKFSGRAYRSVFNGLILVMLFLIYGIMFSIVAAPYFPTLATIGVFLGLGLLIGWMFWHRLVRMHSRWEMAFMHAMRKEVERQISQHISTGLKKLKSKNAWEVKVEPIILTPDSQWVGKSVEQLNLRKHTGAMIAGIERGGFDLTNIRPQEMIYPGDHIFLFGNPEQIEKAKTMMDTKTDKHHSKSTSAFAFERLIIPPFSKLIGIALKDSQLRNLYHVTVVGIQRENDRIIGPHPDEVLLEGDLLLLMGNEEDLALCKEAIQPAG